MTSGLGEPSLRRDERIGNSGAEKASDNKVKWRAKQVEKAKGKDARRAARDAKEPGGGDRTEADYKIDRDNTDRGH